MKITLLGMLSFCLIFLSMGNVQAKKSRSKKSPIQKAFLIKRKALHVLTLEQVASLNFYQRIKYIHHYRRAFTIAEQISNKLKRKNAKGASAPGYDNKLWAMLLGFDPANAAGNSTHCINYGNLVERDPGGGCNILNKTGLVRKKGGKKQVRCGAATGLRGEYAWVNYNENSARGTSTTPYGTYGACGSQASALRKALQSGKPGESKVPGTLAAQVKKDSVLYKKTIKAYEAKLKDTQQEYNAALKANNSKAASKILKERAQILSPIQHLSVVPSVEAHQIKLAADFNRVEGYIPNSLDYVSRNVEPSSFDKLAAEQAAIDLLTSGNTVDVASLKALGVNDEKANKVAASFVTLSRAERKLRGGKLLKAIGYSPNKGIYSNYGTEAKKMDNYYGDIIDYCVGPSSPSRAGKAYNTREAQIACTADKTVQNCEQYSECTFFINDETGNGLSGGRFKDVMDAYITIRDPLSDTCGTLPHSDPKIPPVCKLDNEPEPIVQEEVITQPAPVVVIVPEPEPEPVTLERNDSFGCSADSFNGNPYPISRTASACAVCSLEADAKTKEKLSDYETSSYTREGISKKWLTLLEVMSKTCGEKKGRYGSYNVTSALKYAQVFGHCSAEAYDWSSAPYGQDAKFIKYSKKSAKTKAMAKALGWKPKDESYNNFLNRRFKEIFGFHFQKTKVADDDDHSGSGKNDDWSIFGSSSKKEKGPTYRKGLKDMFCGSDDDSKKSSKQLLSSHYEDYKQTANAEVSKMDSSLHSCISDSTKFAEANYHKGIKKTGACYVKSYQKPEQGKVDTAVPMIISQAASRCGFSTILNKQPKESVVFHESWNPEDPYTSRFTEVLTIPAGQSRRCGNNCDDSGQATKFFVKNKCLEEEVKNIPQPSSAADKVKTVK